MYWSEMQKNILPNVLEIEQIVQLLKLGKICLIPTDTIYGIVGSALNPQTVEQIYQLRKRAKDKPFVILISALNDLYQFNIKLTDKQKEFLQKNWPNPLSVVLPIEGDQFKYLHRGKNSLAFRMPKDSQLLKLLNQAGPLVAPSANFEGEKPAETIEAAKRYFGEHVSYYIDGGEIKSQPSTVVRLNEGGETTVLRVGKGGYGLFSWSS